VNFSTRREPTFHSAAHHDPRFGGQSESHDGTYPSGAAVPHAATSATGFTRFVSTLQIAGSLLAVPLGLASGYSIYRANFSPETTCQALRTNIIGMLDKNVDATTRRMLVRRDIEAFEQNCGAVDPDAHAAFKTLLAVPVVTKLAALPKPRVVAKPIEAKPVAQVEHKPEQKVASKSESKTEAKPEAKPVLKAALKAALEEADDRAASDARWLAAVRQALVTKDTERAARAAPAQAEPAKTPRVILQPAWNVTAPAVVPPEAAARALPIQPQAVAQPLAQPMPVPQGRVSDADHPVPPAPIPAIAPVADNDPAGGEATGSRLGTWIAQIPLVGRVIDPRGN
jgi:hypothetical protein